jgi:hypothetical protein
MGMVGKMQCDWSLQQVQMEFGLVIADLCIIKMSVFSKKVSMY